MSDHDFDRPAERDTSTWTDVAAAALLERVADLDPGFPQTPEMAEAARALIEAVATALAAGGAR